MTATYPIDLPGDDFNRIVTILRTKQIKERKSELIKSAWVVQGFLLGKTLKDPDAPEAIGDTGPVLAIGCDDDALAVLDQMQIQDRAVTGVQFDWMALVTPQLLQWVTGLLIKLLTKQDDGSLI